MVKEAGAILHAGPRLAISGSVASLRREISHMHRTLRDTCAHGCMHATASRRDRCIQHNFII
jgi:hypothetical protein